LAAEEFRKESTGIGRPNDPRMFGRGDKRQPLAGTRAEQSLGVGLRKEGQESVGLAEVLGHNVP
jgi:hypothetical protein